MLRFTTSFDPPDAPWNQNDVLPVRFEIPIVVITRQNARSVVKEYVEFCQIWDKLKGEYVDADEFFQALYKQCQEHYILVDYLRDHYSEVHNMVLDLFDQEKALEYAFREQEEIAEEWGIAIGEERGRVDMARKLKAAGSDVQFIETITGLSQEEITAL